MNATAFGAGLRSLVRSAGPLNDPLGQVRGLKIVESLKLRCHHCRIVTKERAVFVMCDKYKYHRQRQGRGGTKKLPHANARAKKTVIPQYRKGW